MPKPDKIAPNALHDILAHYERTLKTLTKQQSRLLSMSLATAAMTAAIAKKTRVNHHNIGPEISRLSGPFKASESVQIDAESIVRELMK